MHLSVMQVKTSEGSSKTCAEERQACMTICANRAESRCSGTRASVHVMTAISKRVCAAQPVDVDVVLAT